MRVYGWQGFRYARWQSAEKQPVQHLRNALKIERALDDYNGPYRQEGVK
jgi:hypothetical protein